MLRLKELRGGRGRVEGVEGALTPQETNQGAYLDNYFNSYQSLAERASNNITFHLGQKSDASLQLCGKQWCGWGLQGVMARTPASINYLL